MKKMMMFIFLASSAIVSASAFADGVGNNGQPALQACSSLDRSKSIPVGTRCKTSKGAIFENVSRDNFREAWRGPDGLIWSDLVGISFQYVAGNICKNLGGELPSSADFERGEANGFREVLPNMKDHWYWSSSVHPSVSFFAYAFDGSYGDVVVDTRASLLRDGDSVRCVGQGTSVRQNDPAVTLNDRKSLSDSQFRQAQETSELAASAQ